MFLTIKKKTIIIFAVTLILAIVCSVGLSYNAIADVYTNKTVRKLPIYGVDTSEKLISITFDAAWGADKTKDIMDILEKHEAKATFFLVGFWIKEYPDLVKEIDERGFEIGNHSQSHLKMSTISEQEMQEEIQLVNNQIEQLINKKPKYFRPPFGDYNNQLIQTVENNQMQAIQWTVDSLDWKGIGATQILQRVAKSTKNGSIILCHNNSDHIVEALPLVLAQLKGQGYKFVGLSELVYADNYSIDNNGVQRRNV